MNTCEHAKDYWWTEPKPLNRADWTPEILAIQDLHSGYPELARANRIFLSRTSWPGSPQIADLQEVLICCGFQVVNPYHFRKLARPEREWEFLKDILMRCDYFVALLDCFGGGPRQDATAEKTVDLTSYDFKTLSFPVERICQWEFAQAWKLWEDHGAPAILPFLRAGSGKNPNLEFDRFRPLERDPTISEDGTRNSRLTKDLEEAGESQQNALKTIMDLGTVQGGEWGDDLVLSVLRSLRSEMRSRADLVHVRLSDEFTRDWRRVHSELETPEREDDRPLVAICGDDIEHIRPSIEIARFLPSDQYRTVELNLPNQIWQARRHQLEKVRIIGDRLALLSAEVTRFHAFRGEIASLTSRVTDSPCSNDFLQCEKMLHALETSDGLDEVESLEIALKSLPECAIELVNQTLIDFGERLDTDLLRENGEVPGMFEETTLAILRQYDDFLADDLRKKNLLLNGPDGPRDPRRFLRCEAMPPGTSGEISLANPLVSQFENLKLIKKAMDPQHAYPWSRSAHTIEQFLKGRVEDRALAESAFQIVRALCDADVQKVLVSMSSSIRSIADRLLPLCEEFVKIRLPKFAANATVERFSQAQYQIWMVSSMPEFSDNGAGRRIHNQAFQSIVEARKRRMPAGAETFVTLVSELSHFSELLAKRHTDFFDEIPDEHVKSEERLRDIVKLAERRPNRLRRCSRRRLPEDALALLLESRQHELRLMKRKQEEDQVARIERDRRERIQQIETECRLRQIEREKAFWYILGGTFILFSLLQFLLQPELKTEDAWRGYLPLGLALLGLVSLIVGFVIERRSNTPG